ncbi:YgjV family protein [Celerinatantimonas diazotrophica]|nr:YgjV family protein [Celerinatantimonas diazotrophica]
MLEHFMGHFWGQLFGFLSFALGVLSFLQTEDRKLKLILVTLNISNTIHYALFGAMTSLIASILSTFRTALSIRTRLLIVALIFIALNIGLGVWVAQAFSDLWSVIGMTIGTYALFRLKGMSMRFAFLVGSSCWLVNNIIVGSIGGSLLEIMMISVNASTIFRLFRTRDNAVCNAQ